MKHFTLKTTIVAISLFSAVSAHAQYITEAPTGGFDFSKGKDYIAIFVPENQEAAIGDKMLSNQNLDPNMVKNQFYYWVAGWDAKLFTLYDIEDTQDNSYGGSKKLNMTPLFDWGAGHFGAKTQPYDLTSVTNDHILHIGFMNIGSASATNNFKFTFGPTGGEIKLVVNKAVGEMAGELIGVGTAPELNKWYYLDIPIKDLLDEDGDYGFECNFNTPTGSIIFNVGFDSATPSEYTKGALDPDTGMYNITITKKGSALALDGVFLYKQDATGIKAIDNGQFTIDNNAPMYNLAGQKVSDSYKGVVIKNGKKYIQ